MMTEVVRLPGQHNDLPVACLVCHTTIQRAIARLDQESKVQSRHAGQARSQDTFPSQDTLPNIPKVLHYTDLDSLATFLVSVQSFNVKRWLVRKREMMLRCTT